MATKFPYRISIEWSDDDEAYVARVPAVGAMAHGDTPAEAVEEAQTAADGILAVMAKEGRPLPAPDATAAEFSGQFRLRLPRSMHERLSRLADEEGVSLNALVVAMLGEQIGGRSAGFAAAAASLVEHVGLAREIEEMLARRGASGVTGPRPAVPPPAAPVPAVRSGKG